MTQDNLIILSFLIIQIVLIGTMSAMCALAYGPLKSIADNLQALLAPSPTAPVSTDLSGRTSLTSDVYKDTERYYSSDSEVTDPDLSRSGGQTSDWEGDLDELEWRREHGMLVDLEPTTDDEGIDLTQPQTR